MSLQTTLPGFEGYRQACEKHVKMGKNLCFTLNLIVLAN